MTESSLLLRGLQPQPMASYLAALGVLRICARQRSPDVRGGFSPYGFQLHGLDEDALLRLLLDHWEPSPIVTPWNNASGFYASSKGRQATAAMNSIVAAESQRFASLASTIRAVRRLVATQGYTDAPKEDEKAAFIASLRGVLSDDAVAWLDAVAVVDDEDARMMPMLGSGGNEGVLDYAGLFLRSLIDTLFGDRARSERLLRAVLLGTSTMDLLERPGGQFDPGSAGGFNTGPSFESKGLPNNPWSFLLLMEGTLVWASGLASRQQGAETSYRFAVSPFTVRHRAAGYGSAARDDDNPQRVRAEVWLPIWRRPTTLREVQGFIAEGRVEVRARNGSPRRAVNSLDFAEAASSLGVDRGVDSFVRYAFIKRRGESYLSLPAGVVDVRYRREADLLRELDSELDLLDRFLSKFPSEQGPPASLAGPRRAIDDARFDVAAHGGTDAMIRLVRAVGALEMILSKRDPGKEPKLYRPLGRLGSRWVDACGDRAEVRIAAALASVAKTGGVGAIRGYLAPLDREDPQRYAPSARTLSWTGGDLAERLASVLQRRLHDARISGGDGGESRNPTWGIRRAGLSDIASFIERGLLDENLIEELIFGFGWVQFAGGSSPRAVSGTPPLPRSYAALKLLCLPHKIPIESPIVLRPDAELVPLLRAGRVNAALKLARRRLAVTGIVIRRISELDIKDDVQLGRRLAAALLIPIAETAAKALLTAVRRPEFQADDNKETMNVH